VTSLGRGIVGVTIALVISHFGASDAAAPRLLNEAEYNQALQRRHFDLTRDQLITLGDGEYRRIEAEMTALARTIDPKKTWREIVRDFERTHHPMTTSSVIAAYKAEVVRAKAFVLLKDLVTLPPAADLAVRETPPNLVTSIAYAIYMFDDDVLFVTLGNGIDADETETLMTHNDGLIALAAVHEAYPGHRTQNLIRPIHRTSEATETEVEGWGLYAEELMLRAGYYDSRPPEQKLFALRMLLHRAARAFLDPKIHRGDLTPEEAIRFLTDDVGVSPARARIEVMARYIPSPGSAATYLVGKRQIEQLRHQVQTRERSQFTLKRFHDRLLSAGAAPVQTIARDVFHTDLDSPGLLRLDASDAAKPFDPSSTWSVALRAAIALFVGIAAAGIFRTRRVLRGFDRDR